MTPTLLGPLPDDLRETVSTVTSWVFLLCIIPTIWPLRHRMADPRRTHPKPVTWGTWFIVGSMATIGQALGGVPVEAWIAKAFLSLGPLIIAVAALIRHEPLIVDAVDRWSLWLCVAGTAVYVPLYFGWFGPAEPVAAGLVVVGVAILVDSIAAVPTWHSALHRRAPIGEIVTFALALVAVLAVLCILPWPWTWLGSALLCFLALQMVSIIGTLAFGRSRVRRVSQAPPVGELPNLA